MRITKVNRKWLLASLLLLIIQIAANKQCHADVRLPGFFGDHMVLQQGQEIPIWGWADPGEAVNVTFGQSTAATKADQEGNWRVSLPAMKAAMTPLQLKVTGKNQIEIADILIGEVWLCSGQSNMEWSVKQSLDSDQEIAAANYPMIRHMKAPRKPSTVPLNDIQTQWQVCSPKTVAGFTAAGFYMARHLHKELGVPIGLVNSSWGGTRVEPWTPPNGFRNVPALSEISQSVSRRTPGTPANRKLMDVHFEATKAWLTAAEQDLSAGRPISPNPGFPADLLPFKSHQDPTMLYNGMIHALVGFPIRGAVWYQGESNHSEGMVYFEKKKALINGWRELWGQGDFPFYFVQIAPFQYGNEDPTILAEFWEAQAKVLSLANTGMVVINDIATIKNIHPPNKQEVGRRLALLALTHEYGNDEVVASGPVFESLEVLEGKLKVNFSNTGGGLQSRDGEALTWFEIVGEKSGGFQTANATIEGDSVVLESGEVSQPTAMRFAWHKLAEPNLSGGTGLPCSAFRAGNMPEFINTVPDIGDYRLVYELDLAELNREFEYSIDNRKTTGSFDRIGYYLQLESKEFGNQDLFVSMKAFTEDVNQIGIPTVASKAHFQQPIESLDIHSNVAGIPSADELTSGYIEFWPNNYAATNSAKVIGASNSMYDFGDQPATPVDGYGCMQVHDLAAKTTLFAVNHWNVGAQADIGIGNSRGKTQDWTFMQNASSYTKKRLRIYIRERSK